MTGRPVFRLLARRTIWRLAGLVALVEAVFVAEEFTSLMEFIIRNGGTALDTAILAALRMPEVIDFALPLAILIALFFAITSARDANELVVCAAAGVPWTRVPRFALGVGLVGMVASLGFSGWLTPMSTHASRLAEHAIKTRNIVREITEPGSRNAIRRFGGRAFIATPDPADPSARGHLFIFEPDRGDGWRARQAEDWTVLGPRENGSYAIRLQRYRDYMGRSAAQQAARQAESSAVQEKLQSAQWAVGNVALSFRLEELLPALDRAPRDNELAVLALAAGAARSGGTAAQEIARLWDRFGRKLGEIAGRGLDCVLAALMAVVVAGWANGLAGRLLALPVGVVAILGADLAARTVLTDAAAGGPASFAQTLGWVALVIVAVPAALIALRGERLIMPQRG